MNNNNNGKLIGLSLSLCVKDLAAGKVQLGQVRKLVVGTKCKDHVDWEVVIDSYRKSYWSKFPDKAEDICRSLLLYGQVEQPRLFALASSPVLVTPEGMRWWVTEEEFANVEWDKDID